MEASEIPIQHRSGSVRVIDDRLVIEELVIEDERTARTVRERANGGCEPTATVRDAIEVGVRVLEREGTAAEVDYVKAEFTRHAGELADRLGKVVQSGNDQIAEEIAKSFGGDRTGTVQHQIKEMLDRATEAQRQSLSRQFSAEDGSNPLSDFKQSVLLALKESREAHQRDGLENRKRIEALTKELVELKERGDADRRVAEAEDAGTRKGYTFEELVNDAVTQIASARGDAVSHTGATVAEGGGKKGDTLVELGGAEGPSSGRILFEAKDRRLSRNHAWAQLNDGMETRAASFAVLVVAGEHRLPADSSPLTEYEGNKMIVAVDRDDPSGIALEVAYRLAAARTLMARDAELNVDAVAVRDTAEEAITTLKQAQAIRANLTGIKTSADKAKNGLNSLVDSILVKLERIESLVGAADD
jgi:hypothetical protein